MTRAVPPEAVRRGLAVFVVAAIAAVALVRCSSSGASGNGPSDAAMAGETSEAGSGDADAAACSSDPDKVGLTNRTAGGQPYLAYVPATYDRSHPQPLVVALHASGQASSDYLQGSWQSNADSTGFSVIAPQGSVPLAPATTWQASDGAAILAAIDDFSTCYAVDPRRIILDGFSGGAMMSYWLGLRAAGRFSGISIASGDLAAGEIINGGPLPPAAWLIPVSHFHGIQDPVRPIVFAIDGMKQLADAGHPFHWHEFDGGHVTSAQDALQRYQDLQGSTSPVAATGASVPDAAPEPSPCNAVPNDAPMIAATNVGSKPPTPGGGPIPDGTYLGSAFRIYTGPGGQSGPAGFMVQAKSVSSGGLFQYLSSNSPSDAGVLRQSGGYVVKGATVEFTYSCPGVMGSAYNAFDSDGTNVTFYSDRSFGPVQALTLTKQ